MQGPAARWRLNDGKMPSSHCLRVEKEGEVRLRRRFTRATRMWPLWSGDILVADVKPPAKLHFPSRVGCGGRTEVGETPVPLFLGSGFSGFNFVDAHGSVAD